MTAALARLQHALQQIARHPATRRGGAEWLAAVLFVILVVPAGPNHVLIPMLGVTTAIGASLLVTARNRQRLRISILGFAVAAAPLAVYGFARDNAGWVDVVIPLVGGPIAWFLIAQLGNDWWARRAVDIAAAATIAISLMVLGLNFKIGDDFVRWIEPEAFGFRGLGRSRTNLAGITTLIATVPMVASTVLDRTIFRIPTPRLGLHAGALALSFPAILLSGRQGLIGAIVVFPVLMLVRHFMGFDLRGLDLPAPRRATTKMIVAGSAAVLASALALVTVLDISPVRVTEDALASVGIGDSGLARVVYSSDVRASQSESLLEGFLDRPVFGHGAGAVSPEFVDWRGYEFEPGADLPPRPWRAELSYQLLLFEGGVVGALLYAAAAVFATTRVLGEYRRQDPVMRSILRATMIGALSILVGAAFNPHLRAVGAQVLLFLPIIVAAGASRSTEDPRRTMSS